VRRLTVLKMLGKFQKVKQSCDGKIFEEMKIEGKSEGEDTLSRLNHGCLLKRSPYTVDTLNSVMCALW
jgi:hypothetical protein